MVCVPAPAVAGLNVPKAPSVIPVPDHVPPASTAVRFTEASVVQNGPAAVIVALAPLVKVILNVEELGQAPAVVYVTI